MGGNAHLRGIEPPVASVAAGLPNEDRAVFESSQSAGGAFSGPRLDRLNSNRLEHWGLLRAK